MTVHRLLTTLFRAARRYEGGAESGEDKQRKIGSRQTNVRETSQRTPR